MPQPMRRGILQTLHSSHQGIERTNRRARLAVYWPGINAEIERMFRGCRESADTLPSQGRETLRPHAEPERVFQHISMDPFSYGGRNFLVVADVKSSWPTTYFMGPHLPAEAIVNVLQEFFCDTAVPTILYSDNGPQMDSHKFAHFLTQWALTMLRHPRTFPKVMVMLKQVLRPWKPWSSSAGTPKPNL